LNLQSISIYVQSWSLIQNVALSIGIVPDSIVRIVSLTKIGSIDDDELAVKCITLAILYHKDYIKVDRRQNLELPGLECIWVEIRAKPQQTLLNISYRSPQFTVIVNGII
jgi:hypothetical protein